MAEILNIVDLIRKLALVEEEGVSFYKSLAQHSSNEKVRKLAETMARVEKRHQTRFEKLLTTMEKKRKTKASGMIDVDLRKYFMALIDHRVFDGPAGAAVIAKNLSDENEAVDMAIRFEKENILLLLECRELVRGEPRKLIEQFVMQEKAHIRSLQKMRLQLAKTP